MLHCQFIRRASLVDRVGETDAASWAVFVLQQEAHSIMSISSSAVASLLAAPPVSLLPFQ